jgi:two-component system, NtrC family, nitrogen regulation response regulator GlnG
MANSDSTLLYLIDPDTDFLSWAAQHLKAPDVEVQTFQRADEATAAFQKKQADLVLCEVRLQGTTGIEVLKRIRQIQPSAMVILTTALASTSHVIEAMRMGAYDFIAKEKLPYELRPLVESALRASDARKVTLASASNASQESLQETIIGHSSAMQEVFKLIGRVSRSDAPVMVTGESGCGKELVARAIHKFSPRVQKPSM